MRLLIFSLTCVSVLCGPYPHTHTHNRPESFQLYYAAFVKRSIFLALLFVSQSHFWVCFFWLHSILSASLYYVVGFLVGNCFILPHVACAEVALQIIIILYVTLTDWVVKFLSWSIFFNIFDFPGNSFIVPCTCPFFHTCTSSEIALSASCICEVTHHTWHVIHALAAIIPAYLFRPVVTWTHLTWKVSSFSCLCKSKLSSLPEKFWKNTH